MAGKERRSKEHTIESESVILMALLESEYEDLERNLGSKLTSQSKPRPKLLLLMSIGMSEMLLLCTSLQLRAYYFFETSTSESRKRGILQAYATSINLISRIHNEDKGTKFIEFCPSHFPHSLVMAAIIIMKTIGSSYGRFIDVEKGKRAFNSVLFMLRRYSVEDNDLKGRLGKILTQLWNVHQSLPARREQEPSLRVKTRLSASVLHDSLWMWREQFGGQPKTPPLALDTQSPLVPQLLGSAPEIQTSQPQQIDNNYPIAFGQSQQNSYPAPGSFGMFDGSTNPDLDWIWEVGFPSLIPVDIDYDALSTSTTTGGFPNPEIS